MKWLEVATQPLGLVAFALALVFSVTGVKLSSRNRPWFLPTAIILAALVMVAGLFLAYKDMHRNTKSLAATPQEQKAMVKQETHGDSSPAIQGVGGNVTISNGKNGSEK